MSLMKVFDNLLQFINSSKKNKGLFTADDVIKIWDLIPIQKKQYIIDQFKYGTNLVKHEAKKLISDILNKNYSDRPEIKEIKSEIKQVDPEIKDNRESASEYGEMLIRMLFNFKDLIKKRSEGKELRKNCKPLMK